MSTELYDTKLFLARLQQEEDHFTILLESYTTAWNSGNLDAIMGFFVEDGLDYSDYGVMHLHMNKSALREFFSGFSSACKDMKIKTRAIHGMHNFCVWETLTEFMVLEEIEAMPFKRGEKASLLCASLIWWNDEDQIVKEVDYAVWNNNMGSVLWIYCLQV